MHICTASCGFAAQLNLVYKALWYNEANEWQIKGSIGSFRKLLSWTKEAVTDSPGGQPPLRKAGSMVRTARTKDVIKMETIL